MYLKPFSFSVTSRTTPLAPRGTGNLTLSSQHFSPGSQFSASLSTANTDEAYLTERGVRADNFGDFTLV
ncbi:hypothetical protein E2C01_079598 [Portunus trituberculatus]|uniref:Uncharacterized protein n=1 Tax=Portunus trituberculatus TaxID=210409 RepID=A0A5B7IW21_PORTR|nr:hypothetical protein [Portunus trituberculatus]